MEITRPTIAAADAIADCWVELAADQRRYGSRLLPEENREAVAKTIAQHIVTDGLLVAREPTAGSGGTGGDGWSGEPTESGTPGGPGLTGDPGEIVGFVMYRVEDGRYLQDCLTGVIVNLYVRPAARDDGLGGRLLEAAESELAAEGVDTVTLEVLATNEAARRFYARHGYDPHRVELAKRIESDTHSKGDP